MRLVVSRVLRALQDEIGALLDQVSKLARVAPGMQLRGALRPGLVLQQRGDAPVPQQTSLLRLVLAR